MPLNAIRNRWKNIGFFLVVAWFIAGVPAEGIDLLGVYDLATRDDPTLRKAQQEHLASSEILKQAWAGFLPTLTLEAEAGKTYQNVRNSDNPIYVAGSSFFSTRRFTLTLNMPLYRHTAVVGLRQAHVETKRADLAFDDAKQDLLMRVATLYFDALAAQATYRFAEAERQALQSHFEMTDLQHRKGLASLTDLHEARARLAVVEARTIEAEDTWDDALQALRGLNGRIPPGLSDLKNDLPLVAPLPDSMDLWKATALDGNLALLTQAQVVEGAHQEVARLRATRLPELNFLARENRDRSGGTLFGGGSDIETANLLVTLTAPLYQGGMTASRIREANDRYRAALEEYERQRRDVVRATRSAFYGVKRAISRSEALRQAVASQSLALQARRNGYRSGRFSIVDVLDAERDLFEARRDHARARYDYILQSLKLKQATGTLSEDDLIMINAWLK